ncbi:TPA: hypothetical protein N0F65_000086, partial [Lagenidium giganteum]
MALKNKEICEVLYTALGDKNYRCNSCSKVYARGNGYTNLLNHLRTSHAGFERVALDVIRSGNRIASVVDAKSIEIYRWVEWCILERMPFSFCESAIVRKNAKMAPISRDTLKEYVLKLYGWTREKVIQQLPERFGLVLDADTLSTYQRPWEAVTFMVGDNCSVNQCIGRRQGAIPMYQEMLDKINNLMKKLSTVKGRALLKKVSHLSA